MSDPKPCMNCGARPKFIPSDERKYNVCLEHASPLCPAEYGLRHYDSTRTNAIKRWDLHNARTK